jgi:hypothetical protein
MYSTLLAGSTTHKVSIWRAQQAAGRLQHVAPGSLVHVAAACTVKYK